ncbi:MAG: AI-2E family transporter, partial [Proteobacteria bacterium]|nr:AI-2E family transporter [Pseudomonadota bacterium]
YPRNMPASLTTESALNIPLGVHDWNAIRRFAIFSTLGFIAACLIMWLYSKVLIPLFVGMFLAYFVSPWVDVFERKRINRGVAAALIIFIVLGAVGLAFVKLGPLFYDQLRDLVHRVPALIDTLVKSAIATIRSWVQDSGIRDTAGIDRALRSFNIVEQALPRIQSAADGLWTTGANIMGSAFSLVLTPFVTFYLVYEKPRILFFAKKIVPRDVRPYFSRLFTAVDGTLKAVVRGHVKVAVALAILYSVGFSAIGMSAGAAVGVAAGLCRVIPYLDAMVGIMLGVTYVFTAGMPPSKIFAVLGVVGVVQVLDGAFITPRLIGARVGLHPAVVILTVIAAGYHFGFWGVLLAIPVAATLKTIFMMALPVYRDSAWFKNQNS